MGIELRWGPAGLCAVLPRGAACSLLKRWKSEHKPHGSFPILSYIFFLIFSTSKFLDAVFKQTSIAPHHQEYFYEGHPYELDPNLQAHSFCRTARHSPLTLLSSAEQPEEVVGVRYRDREYPRQGRGGQRQRGLLKGSS